jgi:fumarate hydratase subunit alpha
MYLGEVLEQLIKRGVVEIPSDVEAALRLAGKKEKNKLAKLQLETILKNIAVAKKQQIPLCQDTGVPVFYVKVGRTCSHVFNVESELALAIKNCTKKGILRPNIVDPISRENLGDNSGNGIPIIHYSLMDSGHIEITYAPKGAGSEMMSELAMLMPGTGKREIERIIIEKVKRMGGKPCPPYVLGIGIGGTAERCMENAKAASIRKIGESNADLELASMEKKLLSLVNQTGIGPMGLGGSTTCLSVNIEAAGCHTATLPLAIAVSCWADRRAKVALHKHGHTWVD